MSPYLIERNLAGEFVCTGFMKMSTFFSTIFILSFFSTKMMAQNVGIGVPTPLQKLHVGGNVRIDGMASTGTAVITTNASGDLLRTNFSGNANDVLKGNGTFGTVPGGLPSGAIVGSSSANDGNLISAGYSFYGELSSPITTYQTFPATVSNQFSQAPIYENGNPAKTQPPSGRVGSTGLWTGTEVLIWSGYSLSGYEFSFFNDGSRYNPSTDSWSPMSNVNAPATRTFPAAVWTGSDMLIWGGLDSAYIQFEGSLVYELSNTGGKYNPSTNTWASISGSPLSGRYRVPAVYGGGYMVIWGGTDGPNIFENGARYNPTTDVWTSIPTAAPSPGADGGSRMFWTGTYVLVLGNGDSIGRYIPGSNSWAPISIFPGGPNYNKSATIWTGSELWVFDQTGNQIYKYNPATNTWGAVPNVITGGSLPPEFYLQTALWSDAEMIVFGFIRDGNGKTTQNRFYRYNPGLNSFSFAYGNFIKYNRVVESDVLFFKAGSMIIKWGGNINHTDPANGDLNRFSNQGTRIYLTSGISIPTIYFSTNTNKSIYLYQR